MPATSTSSSSSSSSSSKTSSSAATSMTRSLNAAAREFVPGGKPNLNVTAPNFVPNFNATPYLPANTHMSQLGVLPNVPIMFGAPPQRISQPLLNSSMANRSSAVLTPYSPYSQVSPNLIQHHPTSLSHVRAHPHHLVGAMQPPHSQGEGRRTTYTCKISPTERPVKCKDTPSSSSPSSSICHSSVINQSTSQSAHSPSTSTATATATVTSSADTSTSNVTVTDNALPVLSAIKSASLELKSKSFQAHETKKTQAATRVEHSNVVVAATSDVAVEHTPAVDQQTSVVAKHSQRNDKPTASAQTDFTVNDTPDTSEHTHCVIGESPSSNVDTPIINVNTPIINVDTPIINVNTPIINDDTSIINVNTPIINDDKPIINEQSPTCIENTQDFTATKCIDNEQTSVIGEKPPGLVINDTHTSNDDTSIVHTMPIDVNFMPIDVDKKIPVHAEKLMGNVAEQITVVAGKDLTVAETVVNVKAMMKPLTTVDVKFGSVEPMCIGVEDSVEKAYCVEPNIALVGESETASVPLECGRSVDEVSAKQCTKSMEEAAMIASCCYPIDFLLSIKSQYTDQPINANIKLSCFGSRGDSYDSQRSNTNSSSNMDTRSRSFQDHRSGNERYRSNSRARVYNMPGRQSSSGSDRSGRVTLSKTLPGTRSQRLPMMGKDFVKIGPDTPDNDPGFSRELFGTQMGKTRPQPNDRNDVKTSSRQRSGGYNHHNGAHNRERSLSPFGAIVPLKTSANAYKITKDVKGEKQALRKLQCILNKLTPEKFDVLKGQLIKLILEHIEYLKSIVELIFSKAVLESSFASLYANLCLALSNSLDSDDVAKQFRSHIARECQQAFEMRVNPNTLEHPDDAEREEQMAKVKRTVRGNIIFIAHMYSKNLLGFRIPTTIAVKLLGDCNAPVENDIENLCAFFTIVGKKLEKTHFTLVEQLFSHLKPWVCVSIGKKVGLCQRVQFKLRDLIELRSHNWNPRREEVVATTIAKVHAKAAKEAAAKERESRMRAMDGGNSMNRSLRSSFVQQSAPRRSLQSVATNNEWETVRKNARPQVSINTSQSSRDATNEAQNLPLSTKSGPSSDNVFSKSHKLEVERQQRQAASFSNGFNALNEDSDSDGNCVADGERLDTTDDADVANDAVVHKHTSANLRSSIRAAIKEFYAVESIDEVSKCIEELSSSSLHHTIVVEAMLISLDSNSEKTCELAIILLKSLYENKILLEEHICKGFVELGKSLVDISVDIPKIFDLLPGMLAALLAAHIVSIDTLYSSMANIVAQDDPSKAIALFTQTIQRFQLLTSDEMIAERSNVSKKCMYYLMELRNKEVPIRAREDEFDRIDSTPSL